MKKKEKVSERFPGIGEAVKRFEVPSAQRGRGEKPTGMLCA